MNRRQNDIIECIVLEIEHGLITYSSDYTTVFQSVVNKHAHELYDIFFAHSSLNRHIYIRSVSLNNAIYNLQINELNRMLKQDSIIKINNLELNMKDLITLVIDKQDLVKIYSGEDIFLLSKHRKKIMKRLEHYEQIVNEYYELDKNVSDFLKQKKEKMQEAPKGTYNLTLKHMSLNLIIRDNYLYSIKNIKPKKEKELVL